MLISSHRDGEIIANAVKSHGIEFIRGSAADARKKFKDKGGVPALHRMVLTIRCGDIVGVTPDGPRGPARTAQAGAVWLAAATGAPIVPVAYSCARGVELSTWDRFLLATPFSRLSFVIGAPLYFSADGPSGDGDADPRRLEDALNAVCARADRLAGRVDRAAPATRPESKAAE